MSTLKNLFFGRSSGYGNSNIKGQSYDKAIARDPPVKGSYPVAGNGPNVLEEIQRSRAKRESRRQSTTAAAPDVPRSREQVVERPRTAPNDGHGHRESASVNINGNGSANGRPRSGFSMKSPPSFFSNSRRNSLRSTVELLPPPLPPPVPNSAMKSTTPKPSRDVQTYQPKKGVEAEQYNAGFVPPFARHHSRTDSHASHKSYVDLLEAHSNIRPSWETSQHRAKASGVRNYGEDVADRNMASKDREPRLDLNSPEFSYLKHDYSPKKRSGLGMDGSGSHSRTSSALGHVLGQDASTSDDIQPHLRHGKAASIRSTVTATVTRGGVPYPLRIDSPSVYSYSTNDGRDDDQSTNGDLAYDQRGRALSPLSTTSSIQDSAMRETLRQPGVTPDRGRRTLREPAPVVPPPKQSGPLKAFKQSAAAPRVPSVPEGHSTTPSRLLKEPPPVATPEELHRVTQPIHERKVSNSSAKQRRRTMSGASHNTTATSNGHTSKGSYSAFPSSSDRSSTQSPTSPINKRAGMLIEERSEPISLEGVVDLSNTVDTDVTTKTLPAVTHEYITPTRHEIREERITREIHTHDVYHRILPVIETEILPTKHYVPADDGKSLIEIPENELYKYTKHTVTGKPNGNWHVTKDARPRTQSLTQSIYSHTNEGSDDGADGPVIGLARGEAKTRSRTNSRASAGSRAKNILEPILSSKKEYMTNEGYPRTEYVWRHPPVFEDVHGRTQPVYIGAGLGDLSSAAIGYESDEDSAGAAFGAERPGAKGEEELLFPEGGYGSAGMLPGLGQKAPVAGYHHSNSGDVVGNFGERINYGKVLNHDDEMVRSEGEATKALRRMKERRRSSAASAASKGNGTAIDMDGVQYGMNEMRI